MPGPTHKVLKRRDAREPFGFLDFEIVEFHKSTSPETSVVFKGSRDKCDDYVLGELQNSGGVVYPVDPTQQIRPGAMGKPSGGKPGKGKPTKKKVTKKKVTKKSTDSPKQAPYDSGS